MERQKINRGRWVRGVRGGCAALAAGAMLFGSLAMAQDEPATRATVFVAERTALNKILVDPKDRALVGALGMIPSRLHELPGELPDFPEQVLPIIDMVLSTVSQPARVAVTYDGENPDGGAFGYGLVVSFESTSKEQARQMHATVSGMLDTPDIPFELKRSERIEGMTDMMLPFGQLSFGPRKAADGWRYEVIFGTLHDPDAPFAELPSQPGFEKTVLRGRMDFDGVGPALSMAQMFATGNDPEAQKVFDTLHDLRLMGEQTLKVDFQFGYTGDRSVSRTVIEGYGLAEGPFVASRVPLRKGAFSVVPADAELASISTLDLGFLDAMYDSLLLEGVPVDEALAQFKEMTDVDLREDILDSLGDTVAFYLSESTGGGTIGSAVLAVSIKDRQTFAEANAKLIRFANRMVEENMEPAPYMALAHWRDGDIDLVSLRFPGIPVPAELTYALTGDWLVVGATPQAALAGARQAIGRGDRGLLANEAFMAVAPRGRKVTSVSFLDNKKMMRRGYPLVSLLGSAVSNAVRSPRGQDREPGLVVPTYNELKAGALAQVQFTYWDGDDFVTESHGDRSLLVNGAGLAGAGVTVLPAVVAPIVAIAGANGELGFVPELRDVTALACAWRSGLVPAGPARAALASAVVSRWLAPGPGEPVACDTLR